MASNLFVFETKQPKSIFAPQGKYFIFEENIFEDLKADQIKKYLLNNELNIIDKFKDEHTALNKSIGWVDGLTGLGENSLTSRSPFYNVLEIEETKHLKKIIRKTHDNFLRELNEDYNIKLFSQCWANVMRKGDKIIKHAHYSGANTNYSYLGGHICVQSNNTSTHYVNPYTKEIFSSKNELGKITLFPNWIEHYTDEVVDDNFRITIAFDLLNEVTLKEDIFDDKLDHWIEL